ncbi:Protoporphyrinogen oxidase, chloroplastic/mitochondrial [Gracilariopsis chorda]|uniref:Protoporphyrinogen oxidase n=1 Tax=Gracilariopsis chorda TaxID=448386 RepID=A0A2V3ITE8_9FLOR|nr:Protoporphyrinogen oxidase, chloroplastic/mitochondrial [Gracilariopsis chorda]|eukprot:PXF44390.1 Protoporphyrinogen oxidase, chloroplastic/mitochondrial [Gracilariopsis chorda]
MEKRRTRRVAILGGGPAGLSAACRLAGDRSSIRVDLYEQAPKFGGVVKSVKGGGFTYELGPNSMNAKHQAVADLIYEKLKLAPRIIKRDAEAKNFFLIRNGHMIALPRSPIDFCRTSLLSWPGKLRVLIEPFIPKASDGIADRESVGDFFARRFGNEFVDYVVDPALAGIYSAAPASLSMKHALHNVWQVERKKGSIVGGFLSGGFKTEPDPRFKVYPKKELLQSFSFDEGMEVLTSTLVEKIRAWSSGNKLYKNTKVRKLDQDANGAWRVNGRGKYDAVISTIPTHALSSITTNVGALERGFKKLASRINYSPVSVVVLGFDKSQVESRLDGFGVLLPAREEKKILGINFTSSIYPQRAVDPNKVYLTVYLGGTRSPEMVSTPCDEVIQTATKEVQQVLGVKGDPLYSDVKKWPKGIPLYFPGYDAALDTMAHMERRAPGLVLAGNYRDGVGVPDALLSGLKSAERVIEYLKITMPK